MTNWDDLLWILVQFSILSIVIERALYVLFEWKTFVKGEGLLKQLAGDWVDIKPPLSAGVSVLAVFLLHVDMVAAIFSQDATQTGMVITGFFVAGGSKAVFVMFKRLRELKDAKAGAQITAHKNGNTA